MTDDSNADFNEAEEIAGEVFAALDGLDMDTLWDRSGACMSASGK